MGGMVNPVLPVLPIPPVLPVLLRGFDPQQRALPELELPAQ